MYVCHRCVCRYIHLSIYKSACVYLWKYIWHTVSIYICIHTVAPCSCKYLYIPRDGVGVCVCVLVCICVCISVRVRVCVCACTCAQCVCVCVCVCVHALKERVYMSASVGGVCLCMCVCRCVCLRDYFRTSILHLVELHDGANSSIEKERFQVRTAKSWSKELTVTHLQVESLRTLFSEALLSPIYTHTYVYICICIYIYTYIYIHIYMYTCI